MFKTLFTVALIGFASAMKLQVLDSSTGTAAKGPKAWKDWDYDTAKAMHKAKYGDGILSDADFKKQWDLANTGSDDSKLSKAELQAWLDADKDGNGIVDDTEAAEAYGSTDSPATL